MDKGTHILITGGSGQVGQALLAADWPESMTLHAPTSTELDLADPASIRRVFQQAPFAAVINAGAYTGVEQAESQVADAFAVNSLGPAVLADLTRQAGAPLIHVSTDYVFDGAKAAAYLEDDPPSPLNVYGASKLAGELAVLSGNPRSVVLRTSWVIGAHGRNFLRTMLRLAAERSVISVVEDQRGRPTAARDLASALRVVALRMIGDANAPAGVYHFANAGEASWADLAREVMAQSASHGGPSTQIEPVPSSCYPTAARRPANACLSTEKLSRDYGLSPRPWQAAVAEIVAELSTQGAWR